MTIGYRDTTTAHVASTYHACGHTLPRTASTVRHVLRTLAM